MSRAAEYMTVRELQAMTGQPQQRFVAVVLKELLDNAMDAAENAGVAPLLRVGWQVDPDADLVQLTVADNGAGIPRATVQRILNFATRTSDKAVYRSPTRGAQGNALKTVLGIPWALGVRTPVVIEAQGLRHTIRVAVDPAGNLDVQHEETPMPPQPGTRITLTMPTGTQDCDPVYWGRAFAAFNPHISVKICQDDHAGLACSTTQVDCGDFYQATVAFPEPWRKYLPSDPTSAWWYSTEDLTRLVFAHIAARQQPGEKDLLLRDFVKQFRNLSANAKAQAVCAALPGITHLRDFAGQEAAVGTLHAAMLATGKAPSPEVLGAVGEAHFAHWFTRWYGVKRFWYESKKSLHKGIPYVVEVAVAETIEGGDLWTGLNFSPTFDPPFAEAYLRSPHMAASGLTNFLQRVHAAPGDQAHAPTAVAVHVVCPTLEFYDRGKTRVQAPVWLANALGSALGKTTKTLYEDEEKRRKNAAKAAREADARERAATRQHPEMTRKEAVFTVLQEAWRHATGDGQYRVSSRFLFYPVRKLIQELTVKALEYDYFSQDLIVEYQRQGGQLPGLYYDPRGVLYEPHTGTAIPLGTQEVEAYHFPSWLYDKILYVEKKGVWPILQTARLAERYDMAVVAGEGYATEAIRVLFQAASTHRQYQLFVLHDADPDGYNIARTLREETARMPGYAVDIIDLGLRWDDAMALGLDTEEFPRKRALPEGLLLTATERAAFEGHPQRGLPWDRHRSWICQRAELNAFTAPELVAYIERRLQETGVRGKIIPPATVLTATARAGWREQVAAQVQRAIETLLPIDAITDRLQDDFTEDAPLDEARGWIEEAFTTQPEQWWRDAMRGKIHGLLHDQWDAITDAVRIALREAIQDGALTAPEE